jgi:hypothetical protein
MYELQFCSESCADSKGFFFDQFESCLIGSDGVSGCEVELNLPVVGTTIVRTTVEANTYQRASWRGTRTNFDEINLD